MVATADGRLLATGRDLVDSVTGDVITPRPEHSRGLNDVGTTLTGDLLVGVLDYRPLVGDDPLPGSVGQLTAAADNRSGRGGPASPGPTESDH